MIKIYSILDKVPGIYSNPFYLKSNAVALREIKYLINEDKNQNIFNTNIKDKALYCLGSFNEETGIITSNDKPEFIINLIDLKEEVNNEQQN